VSDRDWRHGNPVFDDLKDESVAILKSERTPCAMMDSYVDDRIHQKISVIVSDYIIDHLDKSDGAPPYFEVYVVWFSKTLQNYKALVSSTLRDGKYYEVTYNGDKKETYLDAYVKVQNVCIPD
jgi:hypothetical protein